MTMRRYALTCVESFDVRLAVLDIGSNTGHLLVVDAHRGARPVPAYSIKEALRLSEHIDADGAVDDAAAQALFKFVVAAQNTAADKGCTSVLAFATSALREATNGEEILNRIRTETGVDLQVLSGQDEARITFLAVRRWFGWSSGRLLVVDIGGGSLEIAAGDDEYPDLSTSLPLGAARLTRDWLTDPATVAQVASLRSHVRTEIGQNAAGPVLRLGPFDHMVGTSKTFRSLARICGAAPESEGPRVHRTMAHGVLADKLPMLIELPDTEVAKLPGVSNSRAHQMVAGAVVADAAMDLFEIPELEICPWALREGLILERLDQL